MSSFVRLLILTASALDRTIAVLVLSQLHHRDFLDTLGKKEASFWCGVLRSHGFPSISIRWMRFENCPLTHPDTGTPVTSKSHGYRPKRVFQGHGEMFNPSLSLTECKVTYRLLVSLWTFKPPSIKADPEFCFPLDQHELPRIHNSAYPIPSLTSLLFYILRYHYCYIFLIWHLHFIPLCKSPFICL